MIPRKFLQLLKFIVYKLKGQRINWAITGSLGLALRGVKVRPRDIDIITDKKGAYKINRIFKQYEFKPVKFSRNNEFASYYGRFKIRGIVVEIIGDFRRKLPSGFWTRDIPLKHKETIGFHGIKIPVLELDYEYKFYSNNLSPQRLRTAKKIKEYNKYA